MNKFISFLLMLPFMAAVNGQDIQGVINESASGTTSATAYIKPGNHSAVELTDIAWDVDINLATGFIAIREGKQRFASASATSSTTGLWFPSAHGLAVNDYVLVEDVSANTLTLAKISAVATTSATSYSTFSMATTDFIWTLNAAVNRPANDQTTSAATGTTFGVGSLWLTGRNPVALTLDGNTTSCNLSVSGKKYR